jgi:hypothetical protein
VLLHVRQDEILLEWFIYVVCVFIDGDIGISEEVVIEKIVQHPYLRGLKI